MLLSSVVSSTLLLPMLLAFVGGSTLSKEVTQVDFTKKEDKEERRMSDAGLELLKQFEAVRYKVYKDQTGHLTGGVGHLLNKEDKKRYVLNSPVSERQVMEWLRDDVKQAEACVNDWVIPELTQSGFDALVSLVFNIGCANFKRSTLLKQLNKGMVKETSDEFTKWVFSRGRKLPGLVARRQKEAQLFRDAETEVIV